MRFSYILIASAAVLWGVIGIFVLKLQEAGFTPLEVVHIRALSAGTFLLLYILLKNRKLLIISRNDYIYFAGTGIISIVFFNWCYFTAMQMITLSLAVLLLYTAPVFVILISVFVFREKITTGKMLSLIMTITGCFFISGLLPGMNVTISAAGFLAGIGSGLGYALYSIFAKLASRKYSSLTIAAYTFIFAAIFLIPLSGLMRNRELLLAGNNLAIAAGMGFFPTAIAYVLYTKGLEKVEAGRAAIMANLEPLVAVMAGIIIFGDILTVYQTFGAFFILGSVIIVQRL